MSALRLTSRQGAALVFMAMSDGPAVLGNETARIDGQAWVHWRTAVALWVRGLLRAGDSLAPGEWAEDPELYLTDRGREVASRYRLFGEAHEGRVRRVVGEDELSISTGRMKFVLGQEQEVGITLRRSSTGGWEAAVECPPGEEWARVFSEDRSRCLEEAYHYAFVA